MRAIVAEDSAVTRRMLCEMLVRAGHDVTAASDGAEAWGAFEREPVPLLVLDWQMPGMDGLELCRRVRRSPVLADAFVLVVTARDADGDLALALEAGADDYLTKPIGWEQLQARLAIAERRIEVQRARREAEEALAHARWLAGIGETALALQHEINNPLTALLAHASLALMEGVTPVEQREHLERIAECSRRIGEVVRTLTDVGLRASSVEYLEGKRMLDLRLPRREPVR